MLVTQNRRVGVFIDVQNMYYSARNLFNQKVNFENIVNEAVGDQQLIRATAYTISTKTGEETPFFEALRNSGIEVMSKELLEYESGIKKGDWDVGITIDIIRMLEMLDVVVLVSGDGDYVPLADFIRSRGRVVHIVSFRESTSTMLVEASDIYTNLSEDKRTYLIPDKNMGGFKNKKKEKSPIKAIKTNKTKKSAADTEESRSRRLSF
ncbi:MAG: NYN domain-containing protein [Patescibacteria group bacterium]